jgi:hypothetical protein
MLKRALLLVIAIATLLAAVAVNTLRQTSRQIELPPAPPLTVYLSAAPHIDHVVALGENRASV